MTQTAEAKKGRTETQPLIISKETKGFRVYSPEFPKAAYIVKSGPKGPACTCPDFQTGNGDKNMRCVHIVAVREQVGELEDIFPDEHSGQQNGDPPRQSVSVQEGDGIQMHIKRSVSPDGRIDSLSVAFSCPVDKIPAGKLAIHASKIIQIQSEIVGNFLKSKPKEDSQPQSNAPQEGGAVPATMLTIGGMPTKWGRRLFINIQVNGKVARLFGSEKQLGDHLRASKFPHLAPGISEGVRLHHPCRVVTELSPDKKYLNVVKVLPVHPGDNQRRNGS